MFDKCYELPGFRIPRFFFVRGTSLLVSLNLMGQFLCTDLVTIGYRDLSSGITSCGLYTCR